METPAETSDDTTTVADLRKLVSDFVAERDWEQFHNPKNLAMSIAVEAAELMEHFQWISGEQSQQPSADDRVEIEAELADVLCYCMGMANALDIDIATAMHAKMVRNRNKYPAEEFRGRFGYNDTTDKRDDLT